MPDSPESREKIPSRMTAPFRRKWSGKDISFLALALSLVSMSAFAFRAPSRRLSPRCGRRLRGETVSMFEVGMKGQEGRRGARSVSGFHLPDAWGLLEVAGHQCFAVRAQRRAAHRQRDPGGARSREGHPGRAGLHGETKVPEVQWGYTVSG